VHDSGINELQTAPKDREVLATKLARVVEPLTEAESLVAAARDTELRDALSREIELQRQFSAQPTPEIEAQLREAQKNANEIELKINDRKKRRYQEETRGV
jgi:serine phosphatase RsbU (regulator of sigma subunit)